ncbi:CIC11C00000001852 [Sungouiella intermedia]|uniref:CIC11C00000001852 n=1 Tax=Sungouiella intermedia TaxID=45354 RepID=A0A1L0BT04_9ASCO|nr:CIC11C00000001852 [[Candida] intermedia]
MLDERYKVKYGAVLERLGTQRVLLPLSFGPSSLVLFDMIASLLQEQNLAHKGKQGFELVVLHLQEDEQAAEKIKFKIVNADDWKLSDKMKISVSNEFDVIAQKLDSKSETALTVSHLLELSPSRSLRADLLAIIYEDTIFQTAHDAMATEVISLTVKGRGLQISQEIADGPRSYGDHSVHVIFPLREVLFAEVDAVLKLREGLLQYMKISEEPQTRIVKNMTVQALTSQYFDNLDATGYASTASTVVKTAEKLGGPKDPKTGICQICGCDIHQDARKWLRNITVAEAAPLVKDEQRKYAEAYELEFRANDVSGVGLTVCYGCTTTLAGAGSGFVWPVRASKEEILDEYVLTDDEE